MTPASHLLTRALGWPVPAVLTWLAAWVLAWALRAAGAPLWAALVLPTAMADEILCISADYDLHGVCYTAVITREGKEANRVLLLLGRGLSRCEQDEIVIHSADGAYSDRYIQLTHPFYLKM